MVLDAPVMHEQPYPHPTLALPWPCHNPRPTLRTPTLPQVYDAAVHVSEEMHRGRLGQSLARALREDARPRRHSSHRRPE